MWRLSRSGRGLDTLTTVLLALCDEHNAAILLGCGLAARISACVWFPSFQMAAREPFSMVVPRSPARFGAGVLCAPAVPSRTVKHTTTTYTNTNTTTAVAILANGIKAPT